jgi:dTDP-4-amino-4,6-dideoxygalactose transaminase
LHLHPYYRETYGFEPDDYPVSLNQFQRAISLPIYSKMRGPDVDYVIESVLHVMSKWRI